jgi:hypothetical protein
LLKEIEPPTWALILLVLLVGGTCAGLQAWFWKGSPLGPDALLHMEEKAMSNLVNVMAKVLPDGQVEYLKARPAHPDDVDLSADPAVGQRFLFCGMVTSLVKSFERIGDGLRVETQNSAYLCWRDTMENAGIFAKGKGLADPVTHASGSVYWGFDKRAGTYIL